MQTSEPRHWPRGALTALPLLGGITTPRLVRSCLSADVGVWEMGAAFLGRVLVVNIWCFSTIHPRREVPAPLAWSTGLPDAVWVNAWIADPHGHIGQQVITLTLPLYPLVAGHVAALLGPCLLLAAIGWNRHRSCSRRHQPLRVTAAHVDLGAIAGDLNRIRPWRPTRFVRPARRRRRRATHG